MSERVWVRSKDFHGASIARASASKALGGARMPSRSPKRHPRGPRGVAVHSARVPEEQIPALELGHDRRVQGNAAVERGDHEEILALWQRRDLLHSGQRGKVLADSDFGNRGVK